jgi:hypothetical protein
MIGLDSRHPLPCSSLLQIARKKRDITSTMQNENDWRVMDHPILPYRLHLGGWSLSPGSLRLPVGIELFNLPPCRACTQRAKSSNG